MRDHPLILLERSQVAAIGLGEQHVQVAAAVGRRARDDVEVVRREQHGGDGPHRLTRGLGHAVDAHALLEDERASLARRQRHVDLHLHRRPGAALRGAGDPRVRRILQGREANDVALLLRAGGLRQGEHRHGLQQVALALRVPSAKHRQPRPEGQLRAGVVAEVLERQVRQVHGG